MEVTSHETHQSCVALLQDAVDLLQGGHAVDVLQDRRKVRLVVEVRRHPLEIPAGELEMDPWNCPCRASGNKRRNWDFKRCGPALLLAGAASGLGVRSA